MDFVHDQLAAGRKLRASRADDRRTFSRFSPALEPRFSFRGGDAVEVLERGRARDRIAGCDPR
jgi:putative transposase